MRIIAVGDMLFDIGPRPTCPPGTSGDASVSPRPLVGGHAASVAAWVSAMGGDAGFVGARGDDVVAQFAAAELYRRGVGIYGPIVSGSLATASGLVTASSDEGDSASDDSVVFTAADVNPEWFAGAHTLHVSGYGLLLRTMAQMTMAAAVVARGVGARITVDLPCASHIRFIGPEVVAQRLVRLNPQIVFGSAEEFAALGMVLPTPTQVWWDEDGSAVIRSFGRTDAVSAPDIEVVDSTGVGDAFVAGFLLGVDREDAVGSARRAATRCLGGEGALPALREPGVRAPSFVP